MISNQILQNTIDGLKGITRTDLCVIDVEGKILAATFPNAEAFIEPAQAFVASPADSQVINGCQFFKVFDDHQLEYVLLAYGDSEDVYMIGKIASFQIQNLLVAYKERFDKDNFIKNLLLDNLLLVDIYNRAKKLHIDIVTEKESYVLREKATLKVKVTDDNGQPVKADLGISVFDKAYSNPDDRVNMLAYCYLSSQIRGAVCRPAYYFDEKNADRMQAMDLLLLTQGWRRYVWELNGTVRHGEMFLRDDVTGIQTLGSKKKSKGTGGAKQLIQVSGAKEIPPI